MAILCLPLRSSDGKARRRMELLKKDITYLIGKERAEGNLESITPLYVSCVLHVPIEDVEKCMKEMGYKSHL